MTSCCAHTTYRTGASDIMPGAPCRHRAVQLLVALAVALLVLLGCPGRAWAADKSEQAENNAAANEEAGFGLTDFTRYNVGNGRPVEDIDLGYRYPLADDANLVAAVAADGSVLVFVDDKACDAAGFAADDEADVQALRELVEKLDENVSKGGEVLADNPGRGWTVATATETAFGAYRVRAAVEAGGRRYVSVVPAELGEGTLPSDAADEQGIDLSDALLWVDTARLVSAADVAPVAEASLGERAASFFSELDVRPLMVSLKTSALALAVTFVLGLLAAWKTMGTSSRLKGLLDSVFTIPMVLPPTVCGFLLLLLFGQATPVGQWLIAHGVSLVFTWPAAVLSAIVVSFPLMYRTALGAFEGLDAQMLDAARTLGWSERRIFARLILPLAWPSIAAGTVLAFARAMGEFGCTLFFAGNYAGVTQTIPIAIYFEWMSGNTDVALFWVVVVILLSFLVILFINVYTARSQRYRERGGAGVARRERKGVRAGAEEAADGLEEQGGDALRIDREGLRALLLGDEEEA